MKRLICFIVPFLLLASGCVKEPMSDNEMQEDGYKSSHTVPLKVWLQMTEDQSSTQLCTPEEFEVGLHGGWVSGHATHFGNIIAEENYLFIDDCFITSQTTVMGHFSGVLKAANGDQMDYLGEIYFDFTDYSFTGHTDFFNGTGKFEGAAGFVDFTGSVDMALDVSTWTGVGSITFP